ncbi:hypothetical protein [Segetibacter aerophilus]|uniref:Uncharacterized protein n=1 Tax=Segetibacter aerophilus TaxID=670293 RepID=A0A512BGQ5_9BACT|nr:hypothetical protein [Segetibacter aerophilus]GEO11148.1 hypothetical protein SAE01_36440 [Segetibacter aerophilus]
MSNHQFSILFNGHPVSVTALDNDSYLVQVTYKPVTIQLKKTSDGREHWLDQETQQETYVSRELGKLITAHLCTA